MVNQPFSLPPLGNLGKGGSLISVPCPPQGREEEKHCAAGWVGERTICAPSGFIQ